MEVYPREELFQTPVAELADVAAEVLRLRERMQTRLFLRKDIYGKYVSCLIYLSRDRYNTKVRLAVQEHPRRRRSAARSSTTARSSTRRRSPGCTSWSGPSRDEKLARRRPVASSSRQIAAAVRSWDDDLVKEAVSQLGEGPGRALLAEFAG